MGSNRIVGAVSSQNASSDYPYKENMDSVLHFTFRNQLRIITRFTHKTHLNEDNEVYDIMKSARLEGLFLMCVCVCVCARARAHFFNFCWKLMKPAVV
jgi:hypothetical protein